MEKAGIQESRTQKSGKPKSVQSSKSAKDPGNYRPLRFTYIPGKAMEQLVLEINSKHVKEKQGATSMDLPKGNDV